MMDKLQSVKESFQKGQMKIEDIGWLIEEVEQLEEQSYGMAEKHAEKDIAIRNMLQEIERLNDALKGASVITNIARETNKDLIADLRNLKAKKWYTVYQENLRLMDELKIVKKERDEYKATFQSLRFATPVGRVGK